jgi:DNA-directed RNA polymerase subunit RPC12/RpoP
MDYHLILFLVFVVAVVTHGLLFPLKCPKCRTKLKVEMISDTWGINITKKFIITPKKYGSVDTYYSCQKCSQLFIQRKNTNGLEEISKIPDTFIAFK